MKDLQEFTFMLKHKPGAENKATDALSQKIALLHSIISVCVTGFYMLPEEYSTCPNFGDIFVPLSDNALLCIDGYVVKDDTFFQGRKLISSTLLRKFPIWELHAGGVNKVPEELAISAATKLLFSFIQDRFD